MSEEKLLAPLKKNFSYVSGAVGVSDYERYYMVTPNIEQFTSIIPAAGESVVGKIILFYNHRQCSKSTTAKYLQHYYLNAGRPCIYIDISSIANVVPKRNKEEVIKSIGDRVKYVMRAPSISKLITDSGSEEFMYMNSFDVSSSPIFIIDEFNSILGLDKEVICGVCARLRELAHGFGVSVIGIGSIHVLKVKDFKLEQVGLSPFNNAYPMRAPHFTYDQHIQLFDEFFLDRQPNVLEVEKKEIVDDIWLMTNGHPGMTSGIGWFYSNISDTLTLNTYYRLKPKLFQSSCLTNITTHMIKYLLDKTNRKIFEYFEENLPFLVNPVPIRLETKIYQELLIEAGICISCENENNEDCITLCCPMLANVLLILILDETLAYNNKLSESVDLFASYCEENIIEVVKNLIPYMSVTCIKSKLAQLSTGFPSEYVHHFQLYTQLVTFFKYATTKHTYSVIPEGKSMENRKLRCDIVISNGHKAVIEIAANCSLTELQDHADRCRIYRKIHQAEESFVIHFIDYYKDLQEAKKRVNKVILPKNVKLYNVLIDLEQYEFYWMNENECSKINPMLTKFNEVNTTPKYNRNKSKESKIRKAEQTELFKKKEPLSKSWCIIC
ncbi:hypothetical protein ABK040_006657 [Willaertia magna]